MKKEKVMYWDVPKGGKYRRATALGNGKIEITYTVKTTKAKPTELTEIPTEGKWFEVNLRTIDLQLFKEKRPISGQEVMRQRILKAITAFCKREEKNAYAEKFYIMKLNKKWQDYKLKKFISEYGSHEADWVEQTLEWAQRISNGEAWRIVPCNLWGALDEQDDTVPSVVLYMEDVKKAYVPLPVGARYPKVEETKDGRVKIVYTIFEPDKVSKTPIEGELFEVSLQTIDRKLFEEKRIDIRQEKIRRKILYVLDEMLPWIQEQEKYTKFHTMRPKSEYGYPSIDHMEKLAFELGGHIADEVQQTLEWAQRISNGETWEAICNEIDTEWYSRLVLRNTDTVLLAGGSSRKIPPSTVVVSKRTDCFLFLDVIPLIAF